MIKKILKKVLEIAKLERLSKYKKLEKAYGDLQSKLYYTPGHYYSPYACDEDLNLVQDFNLDTTIKGVNLNENQQLSLLNEFAKSYQKLKWTADKIDTNRYYYNNLYFSYSDAIFLHSVINYFQPKKIIEVGSGFSSAAMLDINKHGFNNSIELTFIEPYPEERLYKLIDDKDKKQVIVDFVQNINDEVWLQLEANDILFIDTSHVSKYRSDVNHLFFNVLPLLKSGVIIHIHDIFFPFDYPLEWLKQGRSWNEAYLLRAFLQYNDSFEILAFPSFMEKKHESWFKENMPLCLTKHEVIEVGGVTKLMDTTGQSIYLRRK